MDIFLCSQNVSSRDRTLDMYSEPRIQTETTEVASRVVAQVYKYISTNWQMIPSTLVKRAGCKIEFRRGMAVVVYE